MKRVLILLAVFSFVADAQEKQPIDRSKYTVMQGRIEEQTVLQRKVIEAARREVEANPDSATAHFLLAKAISLGPNTVGTDEEVAKEYRKAISLRPDYAEAYCGLGIVYGQMSRYDEEIEALNKAISLKPDYADAYCYLGFALLEQEPVEGRINPKGEMGPRLAARAFQRAIQLKPNLTEAYDGLGDASYRLGLFNESLDAFEKAVLSNPNDLLAHLGIGSIHVKIGNRDAAMREHEALNRIAAQLRQTFQREGYESFPNLAASYADQLLKQIHERFGAK